MRESVAKRARLAIYGEYSPRRSAREYRRSDNGQIIADGRRRAYKALKRRITRVAGV